MLSRRVLIIEDDADAAGVLEAYLRRENYDVVITGDGLSGLDMAHRWKPDLILLDVMLPGLNGTEVLAGLRRKNDVPVIMVTAMGDTPDRIGALRYGADDYVVKPYHPGEVVARGLPESEALERVVDTHIYNLRKKLEAAGISGVLVNVRGVGYRFRQP